MSNQVSPAVNIRHSSSRVLVIVMAAGLALGASGTLSSQTTPHPSLSVVGPNDGKRPAGWIVRSDVAGAANARDSVKLAYHGAGYALESGPSSIVWSPKNVARGNFILAGTLYSGPSGTKTPPIFGIFLGGQNMQTPKAKYTEFLVRNDGFYAVVQHVGTNTSFLQPWTRVAGINLHSGRRDETTRNAFRIIVDPQAVQLVVNRTLVTSFTRNAFQPEGEYGIRIGEKQSMQVEELGPEKPADKVAPKRPVHGAE